MRFLAAAVALVLFAAALGSAPPARAQSGPRVAQPAAIGVLWTPTGPPASQVDALRAMHAAGLQHVRVVHTPPHADALQAAHTLGMQLYVDLPPSQTDPAELRASLTHPAIRGVGWAGPLTQRGCARWSTAQPHIPRDVLRYVVTPVAPVGSACSFGRTTTLLVDARLLARPFARWQAWRGVHTGPVGFAGVGPARSADAASGWNVPRSLLGQARALEKLLAQVHTRGIPLAFTSNWEARAVHRPLRFHLQEDGTLLPPGEVVAASTEGPPPPFAWAAGEARSGRTLPTGTLLAVWGLGLGVLGVFTQLPAARRTVLRYLFAHGFYRASLREGRDATGVPLTALALLAGGALWGGGQALLSHGAWLRPVLVAREALPPSLQGWSEAVFTAPGLASAGVALALGAVLVLWTTALTAGLHASGRKAVSWGQVFTMGLLPWWGAPLWALGAAAPSVGTEVPLLLGALAFGGAAWTALRTAYDVHRTLHPPIALTVGAAVLSPGGCLWIGTTGLVYATGADAVWIGQLLRYA